MVKKKQDHKPIDGDDDDPKNIKDTPTEIDKTELINRNFHPSEQEQEQPTEQDNQATSSGSSATPKRKKEFKKLRNKKRRFSYPWIDEEDLEEVSAHSDDNLLIKRAGAGTSRQKRANKRPPAKEEELAFILLPMIDGLVDLKEGNVLSDDDNPFDNENDFDEASSWAQVTRRKRKQKTAKEKELIAKMKEAEKLIDEYHEKHGMDVQHQDMRKQILLLDAPVPIKALVLRKYDDVNKRGGGGFGNAADKSKFQAWIKDILSIPFNRSLPLPVTLSDGSGRIREFLDEMKGKLDFAIAGQEHVKDEIIDYVARIISNPQGKGNILALAGPKGTGKTRVIKRGVAEALQRPFHVINLGGLNDVHVLTGHDMTYSGAKYGRLAQILIQSHCDNPVIYLDEIDKVQGASDKGMEIFRVLTHILDEEQHQEFFDEYFGSVPLDLSKVLFVASLNSPDDVESILRDRLKIIHMNNLTLTDKLTIAFDYVLPELYNIINFDQSRVSISVEVVRYIINVKTPFEEGCRQMKKKLETIIQKLNTMLITQTGYFIDNPVSIELTVNMVNALLKPFDTDTSKFSMMYN